MATQFYLYRIPKEIGDTPPHDEFSFTVGMRCKLQIPSFLICLSPRADGRALLCKIRRTKKPADFGMAIYVYEVVTVHLIDHALMKTIDPDSIKDGRELASEIQSSQHPVGVYYPLCVWKWHMKREKGMSVRNEPHLNRLQFQELVKTGLIGSTAQQTLEIDRHLVQQANDKRLKVIFEEQKVR